MNTALLLVALALMAQTTSPAPPPVTPAYDSEIVVTARRLSNRWKGSTSSVNGQTSCKTIHSTGDTEFDTIGCNAMLKCWPDYWPKIEAAYVAEGLKTSEDIRKSTARQPFRGLYVKLGKCIKPLIFSGIRGVLKQRRAARA